ncbi:hypothetical protein HDE_01399 [Halotydeus destructor]|nr:hypothetical protein HDE_01399 [Halotydeus destructor]
MSSNQSSQSVEDGASGGSTGSQGSGPASAISVFTGKSGTSSEASSMSSDSTPAPMPTMTPPSAPVTTEPTAPAGEADKAKSPEAPKEASPAQMPTTTQPSAPATTEPAAPAKVADKAKSPEGPKEASPAKVPSDAQSAGSRSSGEYDLETEKFHDNALAMPRSPQSLGSFSSEESLDKVAPSPGSDGSSSSASSSGSEDSTPQTIVGGHLETETGEFYHWHEPAVHTGPSDPWGSIDHQADQWNAGQEADYSQQTISGGHFETQDGEYHEWGSESSHGSDEPDYALNYHIPLNANKASEQPFTEAGGHFETSDGQAGHWQESTNNITGQQNEEHGQWDTSIGPFVGHDDPWANHAGINMADRKRVGPFTSDPNVETSVVRAKNGVGQPHQPMEAPPKNVWKVLARDSPGPPTPTNKRPIDDGAQSGQDSPPRKSSRPSRRAKADVDYVGQAAGRSRKPTSSKKSKRKSIASKQRSKRSASRSVSKGSKRRSRMRKSSRRSKKSKR